jgi:hypothetical protein
MKFVRDRKAGFTKSFKLYPQISLKVSTKVGLNFVHFAWTKARKMKLRVNVILRPLFVPMIQIEEIFYKILQAVLLNGTDNIIQSLAKLLVFYSILMY